MRPQRAKMPGVRRVLTGQLDGVVVVADHYWQARKARDALKIDWDPGANAQARQRRRFAGVARRRVGGRPGARVRATTVTSPRAIEGRGEDSCTAVYELPMLAHATMEPMNCTADVKADGCDVYVATQVQQIAQVAAAKAAGLDSRSRCSVHTTLLGGGFGRRLEVDFVPAAVEASKAVGEPVKLIWTREDDMTHDDYRPPACTCA